MSRKEKPDEMQAMAEGGRVLGKEMKGLVAEADVAPICDPKLQRGKISKVSVGIPLRNCVPFCPYRSLTARQVSGTGTKRVRDRSPVGFETNATEEQPPKRSKATKLDPNISRFTVIIFLTGWIYLWLYMSHRNDSIMSDSSQEDHHENSNCIQSSKSCVSMLQKKVPTLLRFKLKTAFKSAPLPFDDDEYGRGKGQSPDTDECETIASSPRELAATPVISRADSPADLTHGNETQTAGQSSDGFDTFDTWVRLQFLRVLRNRLNFSPLVYRTCSSKTSSSSSPLMHRVLGEWEIGYL